MADPQINGRSTKVSSSVEGPITDARQFEVLADPTRWAIYTAVAFGSASTIRDVAERMSRRPSTLYRHFDALEQAGLLEVVGEVETERRPARIYAAPRDPRLRYMPDDETAVEMLCRIVVSAARHSGRATARSFASRNARPRGADRDTYLAQHGGWLTKAERREFNEKIDDLIEFLMSKERREGTTLQRLSMFAWPGNPGSRPEDPDSP